MYCIQLQNERWLWLHVLHPPLFSFKPLSSSKGNQKRKCKYPAYICWVSSRKWFHPTLPLFALNFFKTTNSSDYQTVPWLPASWSLHSKEEQAVCCRAAGSWTQLQPRYGSVCLMVCLVLSFQKSVFLSKFSVLALKKCIKVRLIRGKKDGVLYDWD